MAKLYNRDAVGDLILLDSITEDAILQTLKKRYKQDLIYTYIGAVLISVNPFKNIGSLYTEAAIATYRGRYMYELAPHVFALAEDTYRSLHSDKEDQCVIISGESGAGKTEASKKIMQYIAAVTGSGEEIERVKDQILKSNPVLEAFGNAKTVRNNNSSRFGKYMEMFFDFKGDPVGGRVTNYLLEKSRVINPSEGERSFHIFYMLLTGCPAAQKAAYFLDKPQAYNYLKGSNCFTVDTVNDREEYELMLEGMQALAMTDDEMGNVFRVVSAVLQIGQIDFAAKGSDQSQIKDNGPVSKVANLLQCDEKRLFGAMTSRYINAGGKDTLTYLSVDKAKYTRDAFAKAVYSRLFDWIVARINRSLATSNIKGEVITEKNVKTIGVLDIYGFEIFETNSFEQFCINFVNEKLQQIFIDKTIKQEQEEYQREGIKWQDIPYFNNKVVCELVEKKPIGIFAFLDEECLLGQGSDKSFLDKLQRNFKEHKHFEKVPKIDTDFVVKHYAGDVRYNVNGFIDKNKDLVWKDLLLVGESSTNALVNDMFPKGGAASMGLSRPVTAGTAFKTQVADLMVTLSKCAPHYIRCIKPNSVKKAGVYDDALCLHQVKYLGLLENVRVRRAGFAFRQTYARFLHRYKMLCAQTWPNPSPEVDDRNACQLILKANAYAEGTQYQMGSTKVFIREPIHLFALEEMRDRKLNDIVTLIQKVYRSWKARKYFLELREKSLGLFGANKRRRKVSIRRYYVGDYLQIAQDLRIQKILAKNNESKVLFVDGVDKINRKYDTQKRVMLLSEGSVYNLNPGKLSLNRRIEIRNIGGLSMSTKADNYFVLHVPSEYDYVFVCETKTEFVTALSDAFTTLHKRPLPLTFKDDFQYKIKKNEMYQISFVDDLKLQNACKHEVDKQNAKRLVVSVGNIPYVSTDFLSASKPAAMSNKKPPKPDWSNPTGRSARGISIGVAVKSKPVDLGLNTPPPRAPAAAARDQKTAPPPAGRPGAPSPALSRPPSSPATAAKPPAPAPAAAAPKPGSGAAAMAAAKNAAAAKPAPAAAANAPPPTAPRPKPAAPPKARELYCKGLYDFKASDNRELSFRAGDKIRVIAQEEDGWWSAELNGKLGYIPSTYVELIETADTTRGRGYSSLGRALPGKPK